MSFGGDNVSFNMEFKWNYTPIRGMSVQYRSTKSCLQITHLQNFFCLMSLKCGIEKKT